MTHTSRIDIFVSESGDWIEVDTNGHTIFSGHSISPTDLHHILSKFKPCELHLNHDFEAVDDIDE